MRAGACVGVAGWMEVGTGVAIEFDDCPGATAATGVIVGVGSGAFRAALAGAVGVGRGCPVESPPQAETANTTIAANRRATGLTCASPLSLGVGRSLDPASALTRRTSLARESIRTDRGMLSSCRSPGASTEVRVRHPA